MKTEGNSGDVGIKHVAFIMDGNSTWAKRQGIPLMDGYLKGMRNMAQVILDARSLGIKYLTFYAFSLENWLRPSKWVSEFMYLAMNFFKTDESIKRVIDAGARLKVIGDRSKLDPKFQNILGEYEEKTKDCKNVIVQMAISYGARDEVVRAIRKLVANNLDISIENVSNCLDTSGVPDPDLIIRTSSKQRLSNFLLWQASYSELFFSDLLWPEFSKAELQRALCDFSKRRRTYGK